MITRGIPSPGVYALSADINRLDINELLDAVMGELTAVTAHLHAAERQLRALGDTRLDLAVQFLAQIVPRQGADLGVLYEGIAHSGLRSRSCRAASCMHAARSTKELSRQERKLRCACCAISSSL